MNCTLVVVVDARHFEELRHTLPTWFRNRPAIKQWPRVIVYDRTQVHESQLDWLWNQRTTYVSWPPSHIVDSYYASQRHKMLSAFCFAPTEAVRTEWWLKIDTDAIAHPHDSEFPDERWFSGRPVIVSNGWGYSKPADIMLRLDEWASGVQAFNGTEPLRLAPNPGSELLRHNRFISWLMFCRTDFAQRCAAACDQYGIMPVESQDSFFWYCAKRWNLPMTTMRFKSMGWSHWLNMSNIERHSREAMNVQADTSS